MKYFLDMMREKLGDVGPVGRRFSLQEMLFHRVEPPDWLISPGENDERDLLSYYQERPTLLAYGRLVWGCIIQANTELFREGETDSPASLIYSLDAYFENEPGDLQDIAHDLFDLKNTEPGDPAARLVAQHLTYENQAQYHMPIAPYLTRDRTCYLSLLMINRKYLPSGYLSSSWFPLLVEPRKCKHVMILPACHWPMQLVEFWTT